MARKRNYTINYQDKRNSTQERKPIKIFELYLNLNLHSLISYITKNSLEAELDVLSKNYNTFEINFMCFSNCWNSHIVFKRNDKKKNLI